ncbi:MAG: hypothetical protein RL541_9 [Pseudomonadota bacterium]|jgi:hypothetical protein
MKNFSSFRHISAIFILSLVNVSAIAGVWVLVNQQFSPSINGGTWYCTYQLMGTTIQTTKTHGSFCAPQFND